MNNVYTEQVRKALTRDVVGRVGKKLAKAGFESKALKSIRQEPYGYIDCLFKKGENE